MQRHGSVRVFTCNIMVHAAKCHDGTAAVKVTSTPPLTNRTLHENRRSGQGDKVVYQRLCAAMRSQECEWMVHGA